MQMSNIKNTAEFIPITPSASTAASPPRASPGPEPDPLSPGYNANMGLFSFMDTPVGCAMSCCLPCIPSANMVSHQQERHTTILDLICVNPYANRQHTRKYS